ncbi:MAG: metallophosphoesterase [Limnohabitans sp.]|nr:metallophosphoesterase [Limnohabitans sp.]
MIFRILFLVAILLLIELYAFQAFRTLIKSKWILMAYAMVSLGIIVFIGYQFSKFDRSIGQTKTTLFTLGLLLLVLIPKIVLSAIMLIEDIFRVGSGAITFFMGDNDNGSFLPERRRFISQLALGLAAIPFASLIYGITKGRYNYKVIKQNVFFPDLPDAFDGFTITQISDVHSGSFDNPEKINYAIDLINQQESDIFLFTGDIVNSLATEMHPWVSTFKRIKTHTFGKFSVLGNHDYGEYLDWKGNETAKAENFKDIKQLHDDIGFKLLLNEHTRIKKGNDEIIIVGVENWGLKFKQAGDLKKASEGLTKEDFKILMSHDPSHWDAEVNKNEKHFHLTLSGHTHGLQFGIEIPGWLKWSPAQYVYKQWAGLYETAGRYIYVNRGFGYHAYPGRVGIMPEITVIQLKKGQKIV